MKISAIERIKRANSHAECLATAPDCWKTNLTASLYYRTVGKFLLQELVDTSTADELFDQWSSENRYSHHGEIRAQVLEKLGQTDIGWDDLSIGTLAYMCSCLPKDSKAYAKAWTHWDRAISSRVEKSQTIEEISGVYQQAPKGSASQKSAEEKWKQMSLEALGQLKDFEEILIAACGFHQDVRVMATKTLITLLGTEEEMERLWDFVEEYTGSQKNELKDAVLDKILSLPLPPPVVVEDSTN